MVKASRKKTAKKEKSAAVVTIFAPGSMSSPGRRDIADWLNNLACDLVRYGDEFTTGRYTARYLYR